MFLGLSIGPTQRANRTAGTVDAIPELDGGAWEGYDRKREKED
jgi:hypothetical protein